MRCYGSLININPSVLYQTLVRGEVCFSLISFYEKKEEDGVGKTHVIKPDFCDDSDHRLQRFLESWIVDSF